MKHLGLSQNTQGAKPLVIIKISYSFDKRHNANNYFSSGVTLKILISKIDPCNHHVSSRYCNYVLANFMPCPAKNAIHFFATLSHLIFVLHFRFLWQIVWRKPERFLSQIGTPELAVHQWWKFLCQVILIQASSSWTNQASTYCALYGNFPWSNGFSFSFYVFFSFI